MLQATSIDLEALKEYLECEKGWNLTDIQLFHDESWDEVNAEDPRAFAYVETGSMDINASQYLDEIPPENRIGVLLHEICHLQANEMKDDESEPETDAFLNEHVPEAEFTYSKEVVYGEDQRIALSVQCVSEKFVKTVMGEGF